MGRLEPIPPGELGSMLGLDMLEPIPRSHRSATYVILTVDYGSQYSIVKTIGKVTSKHMMMFLEDQILWQFGPPVLLVMDKGSLFMSSEFQVYLSSNKVEHHHMITHYPQGNGLVVHLVGTLKIMMRLA